MWNSPSRSSRTPEWPGWQEGLGSPNCGMLVIQLAAIPGSTAASWRQSQCRPHPHERHPIHQTVRHMLAAAVLIGLSTVASWAGNGYPRWAGSGPVIKGYDVAGYHAQGLARPGSPSHTLVWAGGTFHSASAEAAERFRAAPNSLAPRFGGYCTGGLSQGHVADANRNCSASTRATFTSSPHRPARNALTGIRKA